MVILSVLIVLVSLMSIIICIDCGKPKEQFFKTIFKRFVYAFLCCGALVFAVVLQICGILFLL